MARALSCRSSRTLLAFRSRTPIQILPQDPRRIRYEVNYYNLSGVGAYLGYGSAASIDAGTNEYLSIPSNVSGSFERVWLTDQEAVCLAVWAQSTAGIIGVSTRETFLTPAPVDEGP